MAENSRFEAGMAKANNFKEKVFSYARVRARRLYLITLIFLLQFAFYVFLLFTLQTNIFRYLSIGNIMFTGAFALFIMTRKLTTSYKLSWLVIGSIAPIFTWLFYIFTTNSFIAKHSLLTRIFNLEQCFVRFFRIYALPCLEHFRKTHLESSTANNVRQINNAANFYDLAKLVCQYNGTPIYSNQDLTYFASGEGAWPAIKADLLNARQRVFIEYYIVKNGEMLDECLDIIHKLVARGVEVYFMFDGACEILLDFDLAQTLRNIGAKADIFMPISTKFTMDHNHRDHRKLIIVDDNIAYTGGINLADEYINLKSPYGYWKDAVIRIQGAAAERMKAFFIATYAGAANLKAKEIKELFNSDKQSALPQPEFKKIQSVAQSENAHKNKFIKKIQSTKRIDSSNDMPHNGEGTSLPYPADSPAEHVTEYSAEQVTVNGTAKSGDVTKQTSAHAFGTVPASKVKTLNSLKCTPAEVRSEKTGDGGTQSSNNENFVLPYADAPSAGNSFSENLYIQALYNAKEQCCIMTPYLILSDELLRALISTATRGVEVMIIMPGIPDKKAPHALARSHYADLLAAGIKLYEFQNGFTHAKLLLVDKHISFVGTVNFDYRSLYLNFENGIIAYDRQLAAAIGADFANCLRQSLPIDATELQKLSPWQRLLSIIIRPFGPLL